MSLRDYGHLNLLNSLSSYLARMLLAEGYLVYWKDIDALQISTGTSGWYLRFSQNRAAVRAASPVAAAIAAAKGVVTLVSAFPTVPTFSVRLIDELTVGSPDQVPIPAASVEIGAPFVIQREGLGTKAKFRSRRLTIDTYVRSRHERALFEDVLLAAFDEDTVIEVLNHTTGTLEAVGEVQVLESAVVATQVVSGTDAQTHEVMLNARLVYVA